MRRVLGSWAVVGLLACGGSDDDAGTKPDGSVPGNDGGHRIDLIGNITVASSVNGGTAGFAQVFDAVPQPAEKLLMSAGDCAIFVHELSGNCLDPCDGFCAEDLTCTPFPTTVDMGPEITISDGRKQMVLSSVNNFYTGGGDGNLFKDAEQLTISVPGSGLKNGFEQTIDWVNDIRGDFSEPISLHDDADTEVTWIAGTGDAKVALAIRSGWHGAPFEAMLWCETEDDGSLTIPKEISQQFPKNDGGPSLFPHPSEISRFHRVIRTDDGPLEIFVASQAGVSFLH